MKEEIIRIIEESEGMTLKIVISQFVKFEKNDGPAAYHASSNQSIDSECWCPDSGATHHVTNDINNLSICSAHQGGNTLKIGDGSCLYISNV
ncbi:hypothetical protein EJ110_NYTH29896 [Nymphaea thermarum]|nr:hypothetical protein EJ110_NYTH29896 [Nymphaea thermarum]